MEFPPTAATFSVRMERGFVVLTKVPDVEPNSLVNMQLSSTIGGGGIVTEYFMQYLSRGIILCIDNDGALKPHYNNRKLVVVKRGGWIVEA